MGCKLPCRHKFPLPIEPPFHSVQLFLHSRSVFIDYITVIWFIIDFAIRFTVTPDKHAYFGVLDNLIDIICTVFQLIDIFANLYMPMPSFYMHSLQVIRSFRLFKLLTYHPGLKVIILSLSKSANILNLLLLVLMIFSTVFGAFIFFAEKMTTDNPDSNPFIGIPEAIWFSLISLTTIGYGDLCPETLFGNLRIKSTGMLNRLFRSFHKVDFLLLNIDS